MTNPFCECPLAWHCKRHLVQKGERSHQYCQGVGDNAWKYWEAWEQGRIGATAPAVPMLDRDQFGDGYAADDESTIGTALRDIFVRVTAKEIECDECKKAILKLNAMTAEQVEYERPIIIADIAQRIPEQAPLMWKALAFVDGVLRLGQTEAKLNAWLTEAIETGKEKPEPIKKKVPKQQLGQSAAAARNG